MPEGVHAGSWIGATAFGALLGLMWPLALAAQDDRTGGLSASLTYSQRLQTEDGDSFLRSDLGFGMQSETRSQRLDFQIDGALELGSGRSGDLTDPRASLSYGIESRNTAVTVELGYREADIDTLQADPSNATELVLDDGTRIDRSARLGLETGREAPIGTVLSLGYSDTRFVDSQDPTLIDNKIHTAGARLRLDVTPALEAALIANRTEIDRDGGVDVLKRALGVGVKAEISPALTADLSLGRTWITTGGTAPETADQGLFATAALQQEMPNGTLFGSLASDLDENGRRSTLRLGRALEFPRGTLRAVAGISKDSETGTRKPVYELDYRQDLRNGGFNLSYQQSFATSSAGTEIINRSLILGSGWDLTPISSLGTNLSLRRSDEGARRIEQIYLGLTYSHQLTEDWTLIGGYTHSRRTESGSVSSSNTDDTLYVGLRTAINWRP